MTTTRQKIEALLANNDVFLFMKGTPAAPQCGFSAAVVGVLSQLGIPFNTLDVLVDPFVREGIKEYANWPTIPQLYIKGQFVGGCDIVTEMAKSGELATLLAENGINV